MSTITNQVEYQPSDGPVFVTVEISKGDLGVSRAYVISSRQTTGTKIDAWEVGKGKDLVKKRRKLRITSLVTEGEPSDNLLATRITLENDGRKTRYEWEGRDVESLLFRTVIVFKN